MSDEEKISQGFSVSCDAIDAINASSDDDVPVVRVLRDRVSARGMRRHELVRLRRRSEREAEQIVREVAAYAARPTTFGDCEREGLGLPGNPCPFLSCEHNLSLDVSESGSVFLVPLGSRKRADGRPKACDAQVVPDDPGCGYTCAAAAANQESGMTLEEIAVTLGVSRERVRQIEESALRKLRDQAQFELETLADFWRP